MFILWLIVSVCWRPIVSISCRRIWRSTRIAEVLTVCRRSCVRQMVVGVSVGRKTRLGDRVGVQLSHFTCVDTIE